MKNFIIILIFGLIPLFPLFSPGLPLTHDGQDHVARIANFYLSLSEGNIIPRWAANLNWGYGHPILMFLYPLPSYMASLFHFLGFSLVDSVKIVFGLSFVLSGLTMYLWIKNVLGEKAGIAAGVLYMLSPYRFVDLYVRGAIGEHVSFVFAPLVLYFILRFKDSLFYKVGLSISVSLLLLSHNALAIMFLFFAFFYAAILVYRTEKKLLLLSHYIIFTLLGFGLSSFFIIPAFTEGKYTLRDIVTGGGEYKTSFVNAVDFFIPSWSYGGSQALSKQIGVVQIVAIILSFFAFKKIKEKKELPLFALSIIFLIFSLFIMTPYSILVWEKITLIQKFQFPWRFLSLVVFVSAILSSFSLALFKNKKYISFYIVILILSALFLYFPYFSAQGFLKRPENFYTGIYKSTTDTGESAPIWSVRFMEKEATSSAEFIQGNGDITQILRNTTTRIYKIDVVSDRAKIRENTLYFPNWQVKINGKKSPIEFQDPQSRGLITYHLSKGKNLIEIKFMETKLRYIANTISVISTIILAALTVKIISNRKK